MQGRCAEALGGGIHGLHATMVRIEVSIRNGIPAFEIVGLCGSGIKESRERVRAAIRNSGFEFPNGRITANFAPAWMHKEGTGFDLPLALALLEASDQIPAAAGRPKFLSFGELSLSGEVRGVDGAICRAGIAAEMRIDEVFVPMENRREVEALRCLRVLPIRTLRDAVDRLSGRLPDPVPDAEALHGESEGRLPALPPALHGHAQALRCLEVAAAGMHSLLMLGSPGSGKTLLASLLPHLLPVLEEDESLEVTRIYSAAGLLPAGSGLIRERPIRAPHHSATVAALIGGGLLPRPGEATLAHRGVLFLDEFAEFDSRALDALRTPCEEGVVRLSRNAAQLLLPSDFVLVGASNPCPCGERFERGGGCRCGSAAIRRYLSRISVPMLDRMDLLACVHRIERATMEATVRPAAANPLEEMKARIRAAWGLQKERNGDGNPRGYWNARIPGEGIGRALGDSPGLVGFAAKVAEKMGMSVRAFHKVLRVSRTIADLAGSGRVSDDHLSEAFGYRLRNPEEEWR